VEKTTDSFQNYPKKKSPAAFFQDMGLFFDQFPAIPLKLLFIGVRVQPIQ